MKIAAGMIDVEQEERVERVAMEVKEERSAHHKRRKVRKLQSKISSLTSLEADVSNLISAYATPQLCGDCTNDPSRVDWSKVPSILQPSAEEEGGGGIKDPERAERKKSQVEVRIRLAAVFNHLHLPLTLLPSYDPSLIIAVPQGRPRLSGSWTEP